MAKDLPYFKFFCSEWNDGDITLEDYETQGLFINICSYYWSNECDITFTKLHKKFRGREKIIEELLKSELIKEHECNVVSISFLDEQWSERSIKSKVNSINGAKGGRPKKQKESENKPNALNSLSETKGIKIREDKKREEESIGEFHTHETFLIWFKECRKYINLEYNVKKLSAYDKQLFNELKDYTKEDFKKAFKNFSSDKYYLDNNLIFPKHFLKEDNFIKYLNQPITKELTFAQKLRGEIG